MSNRGTFARDQDFVYVLCSYNDNKRSSMFDSFLLLRQGEFHTLLRIPAKAFMQGDFSSLEMLVKDERKHNGDAVVLWQRVVSALDSGQKPFPILPQLLTEPHFFFDFKRGFFTIISLEISDASISVCRSKQAEGSYVCSRTSHLPPLREGRITYAAKAHPELSHPETGGGLVVSYITNTASGPADLFQENPAKDLYVPLFLDVLDSSSSTSSLSTNAYATTAQTTRKRHKSGRFSKMHHHDV
jgi:hypothetical protein